MEEKVLPGFQRRDGRGATVDNMKNDSGERIEGSWYWMGESD